MNQADLGKNGMLLLLQASHGGCQLALADVMSTEYLLHAKLVTHERHPCNNLLRLGPRMLLATDGSRLACQLPSYTGVRTSKC